MSGTKVIIASGIMSVLLIQSAARAVLVLSDGFESYTATSTWVDSGDFDPGGSWTINENEDIRVQVLESPVSSSSSKFDTVYGTKYMHTWRDAGGQTDAWASIDGPGQTAIATDGGLVLNFKVYNHIDGGDGWGGNMNIIGFDSGVNSFSNRTFDVSFRSNGTILLYDGVSFVSSVGYNLNAWNDVTIVMDFATDTYSFTVNGNTQSGLNWESGDRSQIQSLYIAASDQSGTAGRGGWDNFSINSGVPEPSSAMLVAIGSAALLHRRRQIARA